MSSHTLNMSTINLFKFWAYDNMFLGTLFIFVIINSSQNIEVILLVLRVVGKSSPTLNASPTFNAII